MPETSPSIIIFGASGDLAWRKLIPSLYSLHRKERLPDDFRIVGYARSEFTRQSFHERMADGVTKFAEFDEDVWNNFAQRLHYVRGTYDNPKDLQRLNATLNEIEPPGAGRLYHLSLPPALYAPVVKGLGAAEMARSEHSWCRVVIEKPFGHDLQSARRLNRDLHQVLDESQIYRIDHYLGKETVQNILVFRFANAIFEPVWNRNYISHVQITAAETVDVEHRARYYDDVGILRDMFQNHLMQLLAMVSMEPPASFQANALRNEKVKLLSSVRPLQSDVLAEQSVRAQYEGYRQTDGVAPDSQTATYAALQLFIDNWRWQGVPFYVRSGKALAQKTTEIVIHFKRPPHLMFDMPAEKDITANYIALCIQPNEGIHLRFEVKVPETEASMRSVDMEFHYSDSFGEMAIPDAYERLLLDALQGDPALFTRADEIERAWQIIDSVLDGWSANNGTPLHTYTRDSWGPPSADDLLLSHGGRWTQGCEH